MTANFKVKVLVTLLKGARSVQKYLSIKERKFTRIEKHQRDDKKINHKGTRMVEDGED